MPGRRPAAAPATSAARTLLRKVFGLTALREGQQAVIDRVLQGRSTLAIMPTGAGKSLCYQLPALLLPGRALVVSPLIALMKDQCEGLRENGIDAVQLNSAVDSDEHRAALAAVADGSAKIIMTTPERLAEPGFVESLQAHPVSLLVVDEAHCISHWGHDFRPAFLDIGNSRKPLGDPVVLALTATATDEVAQDICKQLAIDADGVVQTGSYRPNLDLRGEQVVREADKLERVLDFVREHGGSGIVYAATVKAASEVHAALIAKDVKAGLYHGKLRAAERAAAQDAFMTGEIRVMVATNAFGLGIDKPDIRFVLHYQLPAGLEAYYQEAGRAGRDGEPAVCSLLYLRADKSVQQFFMLGRYPDAEDAKSLCAALASPPPDGDGWTLPLLHGVTARPKGKLRVALGLLKRSGIVRSEGDAFALAKAGVKPQEIERVMATYGDKRATDREGLERMVNYAQSGQCRWHTLLDHLEGASPVERCGHCDNCRRIAEHEQTLKERESTRAAAPGPNPPVAFDPASIQA